MTAPSTDTPARHLADLIGEDAARAAIQAGWDAIREMDRHRTTPTVHSGVADYVATVVILAAAPVIAGHSNPS